MAKATIRSKTGAVITIEGSHTEVSSILSVFERAAAVGQAKRQVAETQSIKKEQKKRKTAAALVIDLKQDGFFEKPRALSEISIALQEKGYLYPVTTLSGIVLGLVKNRALRRKMVEGRWVYGK